MTTTRKHHNWILWLAGCYAGSLSVTGVSAVAAADNLPPLQVNPDLLVQGKILNRAIASEVKSSASPQIKTPAAKLLPPARTDASARSPETRASAPVSQGREKGVSVVTSQHMQGHVDRRVAAAGEVVFQRDDTTVEGETLEYDLLADVMEVKRGDDAPVRLLQPDREVRGPKLSYHPEASAGVFEQPDYTFIQRTKPSPGQIVLRETTTAVGHADELLLEGENQYRMSNATYSTCKPDQQDWYLRAEQMKFDLDHERGEFEKATLYVQDVPMMYFPSLSFPLGERRESGFLYPTIGATSQSGSSSGGTAGTGMDISLPYYWNIAPNYDATLTPRVIGSRGVQLGVETRYLFPLANGISRFEILPDDKVAEKTRSSFAILHNQNLGGGLSGALNLNGVSDDAYYRDLGSRLSVVSVTHLNRQGVLNYNGDWWNSQLNVQSWQTLQDPAAPIDTPYRRLPQITLNAFKPDYLGSELKWNSEFVAFSHPTHDTGRRVMMYPQASLPLVFPEFYITPKIGMHLTHYQLDRRESTGDSQITRSLPIFSVDSGMTLERPVSWSGREFTQTLEPRIYYLNVPYRDQSQIPVFDTSLLDFTAAQFFSENRYSNIDRFSNTNQVTLALTSRLLDDSSGAELLRGVIGQRYYFNDQRVTLPGEQARQSGMSDTLAAISGMVAPKITVDSAVQINNDQHSLQRYTIGGRYQPDFGKVLSMAYRFNRDASYLSYYNYVAPSSLNPVGFRDVDISGQWPLTKNVYGVGRYNYSVKDQRLVDGIAGLEWKGDCWVLRGVVQRFASATNTTTSTFFIQFEMTGFGGVGTDPTAMLSRSISGYGRIGQSVADPVFGPQY